MKLLAVIGVAMIGVNPCLAQFTSYKDLNAFRLPAGEKWYTQTWADSTYLFDEFQPGKVELSNGYTPTNTPLLNYNIYLETIFIKQGDNQFVPLEPQSIKTIWIGNHRMIYSPQFGYMEIIADGKVSVAERTIMNSNFVSSYSGKSSIVTADSRTSASKLDRYFWKERDYYMFIDQSHIHHASMAPLLKQYPRRRSEIKSFVKDHKTDFRKKEDVLELVTHFNQE